MHSLRMVTSSCLLPTINSTFVAFCSFDRRLPFAGRSQLPRPNRGIIALSSSRESDSPVEGTAPQPPSIPDDQDWFSDGREAARQVKMELGIADVDGGDGSSSQDMIDEVGRKSAARDEAMESGRAAARALLESMAEDEAQAVEDTKQSDEIQIAAEPSNQPPLPSNEESADCFNLPARKSHCMTVCFVPPPSATEAWEQLTEARRECKDPGFYRWPPHANILYPFLEPVYSKDGDDSKEVQRSNFKDAIAIHLAKAAEKCKPFDVTIDSFGTFGGKQRGVMWAYPKSSWADSDDEPLIALQTLLVEQFPMCSDQRKAGAFRPHITISHYANNDGALAAKEEIESKWNPILFHVPEIYLLERKGDDGQFKIAATIPLGSDSPVQLHDPPVAFTAMPEVEEEWVFNERMAMKDRRKKGNKRRKRRGSRSKERDDISQESPPENN